MRSAVRRRRSSSDSSVPPAFAVSISRAFGRENPITCREYRVGCGVERSILLRGGQQSQDARSLTGSACGVVHDGLGVGRVRVDGLLRWKSQRS